jgi:hypothetical protein
MDESGEREIETEPARSQLPLPAYVGEATSEAVPPASLRSRFLQAKSLWMTPCGSHDTVHAHGVCECMNSPIWS